jgi:type IV secretion system protein VirB1
MGMTLEALTGLMVACAPLVSPETGLKVVRHESGGNPYAIGVNGPYAVRPQPRTKDQAVTTANALLRMPGVKSIDLGLAMINSANLSRLGLRLEDAFDPCANLNAMQRVLLPSYQKWAGVMGVGDSALQAALSEYNTGHPTRGVGNGYVYKIYIQPVR